MDDGIGDSFIPRLSNLTDRQDVLVENSSEASYCTDPSGNEWIRKPEMKTGCEPMLAEMVGYQLSRRLGVHVPDLAVCTDNDAERSVLSRRIPNVSHWSEKSYIMISNLESIGRMLAVDVILFNEDRHGGNILLEQMPGSPLLRAWAIDHGGALCGYPEEFYTRRDDVPDARNLARGLPIERLRPAALRAAQDAQSLSPDLLARYVNEACLIAREPQRELLLTALSYRCQVAPKLVQCYFESLRNGRR